MPATYLCRPTKSAKLQLKFRAKARMRVTPPIHRTPYGQ